MQTSAETDNRPTYRVPEKTKKIATDCTSKTPKDMTLCVRERLDDAILSLGECTEGVIHGVTPPLHPSISC